MKERDIIGGGGKNIRWPFLYIFSGVPFKPID